MSELLFLTDRYPYNNSETFIENEIEILAAHFDKIYVLPCGLMVDTCTVRMVPSNVTVLPPAAYGNIFINKPSTWDKIKWGAKNLIKWYIECLFSSFFYQEIKELIETGSFSFKRVMVVFRTLAPAIRNCKHFRKLLKRERLSDVIIYGYWLESTILFANQIVSSGKIRKKVCRTHGWDLYSERSIYNYLAFQKRMISEIDKLYFISKNGKVYLENKYPEYSSKFILARLGTRDYGIGPIKKDKSSFLIVSCSHIIPIKRVNKIIDGLALLTEKYSELPKIKWIHFGDGFDAEIIRDYAGEKLIKGITFQFTGNVPNVELIRFYQSTYVDLFINLSTVEGLPVSIMEAASFGIPVVATDVGGTREIIFDGVNGTLIDKDFKDDFLAAVLYEYVACKRNVVGYRMQARSVWENNYNNVINFENFCKSIIS